MFLKVTSSYLLKDGLIFNFGEANILIDIYSDRGFNKKLKVHLINCKDSTPKGRNTFSFTPSNYDILIGRNHKQCQIKLSPNDKLLSNVQSSICFRSGAWFIRDGYKNKSSTNGTWMYLKEPTALENGHILKANHTIFDVNIYS